MLRKSQCLFRKETMGQLKEVPIRKTIERARFKLCTTGLQNSFNAIEQLVRSKESV